MRKNLKALLNCGLAKAYSTLVWAKEARVGRRVLSLGMIYLLLHSQGVILLQSLRAETAGGTAPEVTKFEPVDTTDMVNLVSGDFVYNIPILNVPGPEGGYPLALNYHSGIRHGEEASWVGLGWNLQPGSIARGVKGYPDDFSGQAITRNISTSEFETGEVGICIPILKTPFWFSAGVTWASGQGNGGYVGLSVGPSSGGGWGFGGRIGVDPSGEAYASGSVGFTFIGGASVGLHASTKGTVGLDLGYKGSGLAGTGLAKVGISVDTDGHSTSVSASVQTSQGVTMSADSRGGASVGYGVSANQQALGSIGASFSSYSGGGQNSRTTGVELIFVHWTKTVYWIDKDETEIAYGYYWHHKNPPTSSADQLDRINEWAMESNPNVTPGDDKQHAIQPGFHYSPSYDAYLVMGQGTGGAIKPTRRIDGVFRPRRARDEWWEADHPLQAPSSAQFVFVGDNSERIPYGDYLGSANRQRSISGRLEAADAGDAGPTRSSVNGVLSAATSANTAVTQEALMDDPQASRALFLGKDLKPAGSRKIDVGFASDQTSFSGFSITETDGKKFHFADPAHQWWSVSASANQPYLQGEWQASRVTIDSPYAYAWYLSDVTYPDYVAASPGGPISENDLGGWVKFAYVVGPTDYRWHSSSDGQLNDGPINRVDRVGPKKAGMMYSMEYGSKELKYPYQIQTATHTAIFSTSPRQDTQEISNGGVRRNVPVNFKSLDASGKNETTFNPASDTGKFEITYNTPDVKGRHRKVGIEGSWPLNNMWVHSPNEIYYNSEESFDISIPGLPHLQWSLGATPPSDYDGRGDLFYYGTHPRVDTAILPVEGVCFSINSVSVRLFGIERTYTESLGDVTFYDLSHLNENQQPEWSSAPVVISHKYLYKLKFSVSDQFWSNGFVQVDKSPGPFQGIRSAWVDVLSTLTASGGSMNLGSPTMQKLDDIYLVERASGKLVKQVHFDYSYDLCPNTPNTDRTSKDPVSNLPINPSGGKLTLKSVQTFGQGGMPSNRAQNVEFGIPAYQFSYDPRYNKPYLSKQAYDRWGFHKSDGSRWNHRDAVAEDQMAWVMTKIQLPSGGQLRIDYEAKDYARVQDRLPMNPLINQAQIGQYKVDMAKWLTAMGLASWPKTDEEWVTFGSKVNLVPMELYPASGEAGVPATRQTLPKYSHPIGSAPNPKDLVTTLKMQSPAYQEMVTKLANTAMQLASDSTAGSSNRKSVYPAAAMNVDNPTETGTPGNPIEAMVQFRMEWMTTGDRTNRTLESPYEQLDPNNLNQLGNLDRSETTLRSALVRMAKLGNGRAQVLVMDPDFQWPRAMPKEMYVTWTPSGNKVGGGCRVKRVVAFDGQKTFSTSYTYSDLVNGDWVSSGVAASEPPPFSYAVKDDRVIQTETGGWGNESNGGIYHSRVTVRHSWTESKYPAGGEHPGVPLGETVFRFLTPADLPHRQAQVDYVVNDSVTSPVIANGISLTEVFNVGAWWGQPLWQEKRDASGRVLNRVEHVYGQLRPYLQFFKSDEWGRKIGQDAETADVEANPSQRPTGMGYQWASPDLLNILSEPSIAKNQMGIGFTRDAVTGGVTQGYLNASVNLTTWQSLSNNNSTVNVVREISLPPVKLETRTYGDNLRPGIQKPEPTKVEKADIWDQLTGTALEHSVRGRQAATGGYEWLVTRVWPAYWVYDGMKQQNMLSQVFQTTTSRRMGDIGAAENLLNSKVTTWWQPIGNPGWFQGGEFVWNGLGIPAFPTADLPANATDTGWTPARIMDGGIGREHASGSGQTFRQMGWLLSGAVTQYDGFGHALEAMDGDGVYGCSKYGYPYKNDGSLAVALGTLPIAKFANARNPETQYFNFETGSAPYEDDPLKRLEHAYTGDAASNVAFTILNVGSTANGSGFQEVRYFVQSPTSATASDTEKNSAFGTLPGSGATLLQIVPCEKAPSGKQWWMVRLKVPANTALSFGTGRIDDVSVYPWRRNGVPASVSHFAYDRATGQVTSITGSNGRTTRYRYDRMGRVTAMYDAYGKPVSSTRYRHVVTP